MTRFNDILYITAEADGSCLHLPAHKEIHVRMAGSAFLDQLCIQNGSTLEGRTEAFRRLTGTSQKPAVLVSERTQTLFFPTMRADHRDCVWIRYDAVFRSKACGSDAAEILFHTGDRCTIPFNYRIINKQLSRCAEFLEKINSTAALEIPAEAYDDLYRTGLSGLPESQNDPEE